MAQGVKLADEVQKVMVTFPVDLHRDAAARARREERSLSQLVRLAVRRYLDGGGER